jgi:hypothetical protein
MEEFDQINKPLHYNMGKIETIEYIEQIVKDLQGIEAVYVGNIIKYISRYQYKNKVEDLLKAQWYLNKLIELKKVNDE